MSPNLTSLLAGIVLTILWSIGLKKGMMFSLSRGNLPRSRWTRREIKPFSFWTEATIEGVVALAIVIVSIVRWEN